MLYEEKTKIVRRIWEKYRSISTENPFPLTMLVYVIATKSLSSHFVCHCSKVSSSKNFKKNPQETGKRGGGRVAAAVGRVVSVIGKLQLFISLSVEVLPPFS